MKKILKEGFYCVVSVIQVGLAWFGVNGSTPLFNVFKFLTITAFAVGILTTLTRDAVRAKDPNALRHRPKVRGAFAIAGDVISALIMAAFGHFGYAAMLIVQPMMESYVYAEETPKAKEVENGLPRQTN